MCLAIPSKVIEKYDDYVVIDTMGVKREASLDLMQEEVSIGEYILLHVGYVISKISLEDAKESLALYQQMIDEMPEED